MAEAIDWISDEFRRMDDELAAAVMLPGIDAVVRRTGTMNRASTAAAAAVLTVGALGGVTAVAQAGTSTTSLAAATPLPTPVPTVEPTLTEPSVSVAPAPPATRAVVVPTRRRAELPVRPLVPPAPVVLTTVPVPVTAAPIDEGTEDPPTTTRPPRTTKPTRTSSPTVIKTTDPDPPPSDPSDPPSADPTPAESSH